MESTPTTAAAGHIPSPPKRPAAHRLASELARVEALDAPAQRVLGVLGKLVGPGPLRDVLSGTPLGHALHPLLTDLPIGAWTSATILDATGGSASAPAARRLVGVGVLTALPTAATGWVEWGDSAKVRAPTRRVGLVHAAANVAALTLYGASYLRRRRGHGGRALAFAGAGALAVGGHLGGHLAYVHGEGVAETTFEDGTRDWVATVPVAELSEGEPIGVEVAGVHVLLVLRGGVAYALADRCTHRGGALHEGELEGDCIVCPLHGSRFALDDGSVQRGPASSPQPAYETRISDGKVELRQATDPTP